MFTKKKNPIPYTTKSRLCQEYFQNPGHLCLQTLDTRKRDGPAEGWLQPARAARLRSLPSPRRQTKVRYGKHRGPRCKTDSTSQQVWLLEFSTFANGCGLGTVGSCVVSGRVLAAVQLPDFVVVSRQQDSGSGVRFQGTSALSPNPQNAAGLWAVVALSIRGGAGQREPLTRPQVQISLRQL